MSQKYRELSTDAELELCLASCECDGFDWMRQFRKAQKNTCEYAACLCGARRGRRRPQGGWSVVVSEAVRSHPVKLFDPLKVEQILNADPKDFSITGNPDGSPMNKR